MHDPKTYHNDEVPRFEKEVQQKMEDLSFHPSEAVWANIANAVGGEKKRRRLPVFWLFFLPAFLLMGTAGIYFFAGGSGKTGTAASQPSKNQPLNNRQLNSSQASNDDQPNDAPSNTQQLNNQSLNNLQPANQQTNDQPANNQRSNSRQIDPNRQQTDNDQLATGHSATTNRSATIAGTVINQPAATHPGTLHPAAGKPENDRSDNNETDATAGITMAGGKTVPARTTPPARTNGKPAINGKNTITGREATLPSTEEGPDGSSISDNIVSGKPIITAGEETSIGKTASIHLSPVSGRNAPKITAAPLATKSLAITKTQLRPKRPWEAGFAGGIGVSSLNQALLKRSAIAASDNRNSTAAITGQPQTYISKIQPDLAFWAGIVMQKPLSNRLSFSTGLNLRYYSTRLRTGDKVDLTGQSLSLPTSSYNYTALSAITYAAAPPTSYPYYAAGDKQVFINRYYFLEIPGSVEWQITPNRRLPVFWEAGFSLSYLMGSNALYYNNKAGVYYKDGDVTNKFQFNLSTALLFGIPFQGVNLQVGPQAQYGLTNLLNTQNSGQHLFYGGIKMVVIPGKSHKASHRLFKEE